MKIKKILIVISIMTLLAISIGAYAISSKESAHKNSVNEFLDDVNKDLINSYEVLKDTDNYMLVNNEIKNRIISGEVEGLNDNDMNVSIINEMRKLQIKAPKKSTYPIIMLKKDGNEIIIAYKTKEGVNTLISSKIASEGIVYEELHSESKYHGNGFMILRKSKVK